MKELYANASAGAAIIFILVCFYVLGMISNANSGYEKGFNDGIESARKNVCLELYRGKPTRDVQIGCVKYFN